MFRNLIRKLSGIKSYDELLNKSIGLVKVYADKDNSVVGFLARSEEHLQSWIGYITPGLVEISNAASKQEQIFKLREKTIEMIEISSQDKILIGDERSKEEKEIIAKTLFKDSSFEEALTLSSQSYIYAEASIACYRLFSMELNDANKNDWLPMYCDLYNQFITQLHNQMIAKEKDEVNVLESMLPAITQVLEETRKKVLQGYQWDYDREKIELENEEEDRGKKAEEESFGDVDTHYAKLLTARLKNTTKV